MAYTKRLGHLFEQAFGDYLLHTAQPSITTVVRDIVVWNADAQPADFHVYLSSPGVGGRYALLDLLALPSNQSGHEEMRQVVLEGEEIRLDTNSPLFSALVTGYQLVD